MHGQYMMNKQISVQYAYKKDDKGERHGGPHRFISSSFFVCANTFRAAHAA
jgi:hypothetical protein